MLGVEDGAGELGGRHAGEDVHRQLRPYAGDRDEQVKQLFLLGSGEGEQLQRILADVRVAAQLDPVALRGQRAHRLQREVDQVPHAADIDDRRLGALLQKDARKPGDHLRPRALRKK